MIDKMRILMVQPQPAHHIGFNYMALTEPLGIEAVAGALTAHHQVKILDMRLNPNLYSVLAEFKPQAVGVAVPFTTAVYRAREVVREVKEYNSDVFTFVGGHHVTLSPQDCLDEYTDAVVIGEGEETVNELLAAYEGRDLEGVRGIAFRREGQNIFNAPRSLIANLDGTPKPERKLLKEHQTKYFYKNKKPLTMLETARGCPYRCKFCSVWKFYQGKYRVRSAERVVDELKAVETKGVLFSDDNFLHSVTRAEEICRGIKKAGLKKNFGFQARSDTIAEHPEIIKQWREVGLDWVLIGFESFMEEELQALNKKNTLEANEKAVKILRGNNIEVQGAFIVSPWYGRREFKLLSNYIKKLKLFSPQITILTPLPGTDFFKEKWEELTTKNYELFDFLHAVLPTKIPLKDFYRQFCKLYRSVSIGHNAKAFLSSPFSYSFKDIWEGLRVINNMLRAKSYLKGHQGGAYGLKKEG